MLLKIGSVVVQHLSSGQHFAFGVSGDRGRKETPGKVDEKLFGAGSASFARHHL